jgi:ABC-type transport system involved in multi-copper enzyme maturation permease subunit
MTNKNMFRLISWEIEEYFSFPVIELVFISTLILMLHQQPSNLEFTMRYKNLNSSGIYSSLIVISFTTGAIVSRSFAGSLARGESKMLLSTPVKRSELFLSKITAQFFVLFCIYLAIFSLNIPLLALDPFNLIFYCSVAALFIQIFLSSSIAISISLLLKSEAASILASVLLLFGLEILIGEGAYYSATGRYNVFFTFAEKIVKGVSYGVNTQDVLLAIFIPLVVSISLLGISFVYFTRVIQLD